MEYFVISFIGTDGKMYYVNELYNSALYDYKEPPYYDYINKKCLISGYNKAWAYLTRWKSEDAFIPEDNFDLDHIVLKKVEFTLNPVAFKFS